MHGHRSAGGNPDDGQVGDVAVHALCVECAMGHVEEGDIRVRRIPHPVEVRVGAQATVGLDIADAVVY